MIKINNNLTFFFGLSALVGAASMIAMQRSFSVILQSTVTTCQAYVESLSIRLPHISILVPLFFIFILLAGITIKLIVTFMRVHYLKRKLVVSSILYEKIRLTNQKYQLKDKTIVIRDNKPFAFCFGLVHPKIYISTATLAIATRQELEAILIHERYHLQKNDPIIVLLISTVKSLFPFIPLFSDFLKSFQIEQELKADQEVIRVVGSAKPILSILKKLLQTSSHAPAFAPAFASRETLEPRIKALVSKDFTFKKYAVTNMIISFISLIFLAAAVYSPVQAVDIHNKQFDSVLLCVSGKECINACQGKNAETSSTVKRYSPAINASYTSSEF